MTKINGFNSNKKEKKRKAMPPPHPTPTPLWPSLILSGSNPVPLFVYTTEEAEANRARKKYIKVQFKCLIEDNKMVLEYQQ